jgi:hypothetical protein
VPSNDGGTYRHFEEFVTTSRPWGLGTEYLKFQALISSEIGERGFVRLTASEPAQGERADLTSAHDVPRLHEQKSSVSEPSTAPLRRCAGHRDRHQFHTVTTTFPTCWFDSR